MNNDEKEIGGHRYIDINVNLNSLDQVFGSFRFFNYSSVLNICDPTLKCKTISSFHVQLIHSRLIIDKINTE